MIIAMEMTLVLGGVLGLAVYELWRLRRDRREKASTAQDAPKRD
jgi:hypothetical protein